MRSIRATLPRNVASIVLATSTLLSLATHGVLRPRLTEMFEAEIESDLRLLANGARVWVNGDVYLELNSALLPEYDAGGDRAFIVHDVDGEREIGRSASLEAGGGDLDAAIAPRRETPGWGWVLLADGTRMRIATQIMPAQWDWDPDDLNVSVPESVRNTEVRITVGRNPASLRHLLDLMAIASALAVFVTTGVTWFATRMTLRRALRPIGDLTRELGAIADPRGPRLDVSGYGEMRAVQVEVNALLDRLAEAARRDARFTADAVHELRTPIAELRTLTDVALAFPDSPERLTEVVRSANALGVRMTSLVRALMGITKWEAVRSQTHRTIVDLPKLIRETVSSAEDDVAERGHDVRLDLPDFHDVRTDPALIASIIGNLIGNAVAYAPSESSISISYSGGTHGFWVEIINDVVDLTPTDVEAMFDPFWRKAGRRSDDAHSGLGLTLARAFAEMLELELDATLLAPDRFQVVLRGDPGGGRSRS